jgi:hypothetical protein
MFITSNVFARVRTLLQKPFSFKKIAVNSQFLGWNKALLVLEKFFHYPHWFFKFSRVKNCSILGSVSFFWPGNVILQTYGFMINSAEKFLLGTGKKARACPRTPPPPSHAWIASVHTAAILGLVLLGVG